MYNSQAHTQVCVHTESYSCANTHVPTHWRLESPLDSKAIRPVNTKGNQWKDWCWNWSSIALAVWCRADSLEKTLMLGKIEGRRRGRQRMRWLDGITDLMDVESEWTPGVAAGHGGLACSNSWGRKESDTTKWLNGTELKAQLNKIYSKSR